jgi:hypothetical protein
MLSLSMNMSDREVDLELINGVESDSGGGLEFGNELMKFAEAIAGRHGQAIAAARETLHAIAGPSVVIDAAAVAANFQRMVRIADSTGIPLDEANMSATLEIQQSLNLRRFESANNSVLS